MYVFQQSESHPITTVATSPNALGDLSPNVMGAPSIRGFMRMGGVAQSLLAKAKGAPSIRGFMRMGGVAHSLLATALLTTALTGCHSGPPPGGPGGPGGPMGPLPVLTATASQQDVPVTGSWVATTDGFINASIQPQVAGYLIRQDYREGSEVHKGQVLFEIDPRPFQAQLDQQNGTLAQARAQVAQAQANLELANINVCRDTPLAAAHAIAQSQLDQETQTVSADKAAVGSAEAQVKSAQALVATAALNLGFTRVRSLIDGVAGQAALQVGNLVGTTSVLTSVSQVNPIKVYFYLSEQEYLALIARARQTGKPDLLNAGSAIPLTLTLANNEVYPQTGRIIFVDRSVSAQTGSIRLAASFPNPGNVLRPGQFGRITAQTQVLQNAVTVPQRAVTELQGMNQIYVVGPDNTAHVRTVQLGTQIQSPSGQQIVITSGLQPNETVITEGLDKLKDGMKVQPQPDPALNPNANPNGPKPPAGS